MGEGHFGFTLQRKKHNVVRVTPVFSIGMKDEEAIDLAAEILQRHGLPVYRPPMRNGMHTIQVTGAKRLKRYVDTLLPHLRGQKREAARLVGEYVDSRMGRPYASPYTEREVELIKLNRLGNAGNRGKLSPDLLLANPAFAAHQTSKTHCPQGHEYSPENTTYSNTGARRCIICDRAAKRRYAQRTR